MNLIIDASSKGIEKSEVKASKISIVSDIPFPANAMEHLGVDFFQVLRGRAIAFATGLKLANPVLKVMPVIGDLMTIGGNHLVHSARRNMELTVICINNFVYRKVAGETAPVSQRIFSPYSTFEEPFNIPHIANSCGAVYTARWTAMHTNELATSIAEALNKRGLSVIEVLAPGANYYTADIEHNLADFYYKNSEIKTNELLRNVGITADNKIVVGKFIDKEKPTFIDVYNTQLQKVLGDKFTPSR